MKVTTEYDDSKTFSGLPAPEGWHIIDRRNDGFMWQRLFGEAIKVIESVAVEKDDRRWLHVSVSKPKKTKMPTYEDIQTARKLFIGEHRECYQVFPTADRYVNVNPVLHLFCCLDQPEGVLPPFEGMIAFRDSITNEREERQSV
jgi:hypothetical protein